MLGMVRGWKCMRGSGCGCTGEEGGGRGSALIFFRRQAGGKKASLRRGAGETAGAQRRPEGADRENNGPAALYKLLSASPLCRSFLAAFPPEGERKRPLVFSPGGGEKRGALVFSPTMRSRPPCRAYASSPSSQAETCSRTGPRWVS